MAKKVKNFFNKYGIENLMFYIVAANILVFVVDTLGLFANTPYKSLTGMLMFDSSRIFGGEVWRLITFIFAPESVSILFAFLTFYFYYIIGSTFERMWGAGEFNIYYLVNIASYVIMGLLGHLINTLLGLNIACYLTSENINLGLFLAFAWLFPDFEIMLFFFIPIKIKYLGILDAVLLLINIVSGLLSIPLGGISSIAGPMATIGIFLLYFGKDFFAMVKMRTSSQKNKVAYTAKVTKIGKNDSRNSKYIHKCCVCGRTENDSPSLVFRYCVKCNGLKEYCIDHINNHEHV